MHEEVIGTSYGIVFWLITPPNNMKSFIQAVAKHWHGDVSVIACHDVSSERAASGFEASCEGVKELLVLDGITDGSQYAYKYIDEHRGFIHVFCGIRREPAPYMYYMRRKYPNSKIVAITEKPAPNFGPLYKRIIKKLFNPILYKYIFFRAEQTVDAMFVCSRKGLQIVEQYGWKKNNLHNFMYCDSVFIPEESVATQTRIDKRTRFLYVGRFDYRMRGLDIIMGAFDQLLGDWSLDLVGGYGENSAEVIQWAKTKDNVNYMGRWASDEIPQKMKNYDVYLCASKEDSWNGQTNIALSSGLGVITTDEAGSDELITESGAGTVVVARSIPAYLHALQEALRNENTEEWKMRAIEYAERISPSKVAEYFCNILENIYLGSHKSEECPWIKM